MDPRIPVNQQNPPSVMNNPPSSYIQPQMNKFGTNGHAPYIQQSMRPPNFQTSPRMGRNVATVGPMTGKLHQLEGVAEYPSESVMQMHNQVMCSNVNVSGDPLSGNYQRGPPIYQHPTASMMVSGPNVRTPNIPSQQQSAYNQIPSQLSMDMLPQQRFQAPMQPPAPARFTGASSNQQPTDSGILDATSMPAVGHPSPYDSGFGVKPVSTTSGVLRPLPPQLPPQQPFASQQPPLSSPLSMAQPMQHQQAQSNSVMPLRSIEAPDPIRQSIRPPSLGVQQHPVPPPLPQTGQQTIGTLPPMPPSGSTPSFPVPARGTLCLLCSRDLADPPVPPSSLPGKPLPCNYPPVQCEAGCRGWFHLHCSGLTPEAFYLLKAEGPLVEWLCTPCATQAYPNIPYIRLRH